MELEQELRLCPDSIYAITQHFKRKGHSLFSTAITKVLTQTIRHHAAFYNTLRIMNYDTVWFGGSDCFFT